VHRFYLPPAQCSEPVLFLSGREAHHALHVLRLRRGEHISVLDGEGREFVGEITAYDRDKVSLRITEKRSLPAQPWQITLLQAIPKGKLFESIIQKATELGVFRIVPLLSERVVLHVKEKQAHGKTAKWQQTAIEAIKQCGSPWLPKVELPQTPRQFLAGQETFELPLIASLQPGASHPRQCFREFQRQHARRPKSICIWIGPEGDFSPEEIALIQSGGAHPITLGPLVLRTETAAIFCLSCLNYELSAPD